MKFVAVIFSARFWLALMVSITMGIGTAAADIHPPDPDEIACEETQALMSHDTSSTTTHGLNSAETDKEESQREHDHHEHSCGSCHVHLVGTKVPTVSAYFIADPNLYLGADQTVPRAGPFGLYRPPRA